MFVIIKKSIITYSLKMTTVSMFSHMLNASSIRTLYKHQGAVYETWTPQHWQKHCCRNHSPEPSCQLAKASNDKEPWYLFGVHRTTITCVTISPPLNFWCGYAHLAAAQISWNGTPLNNTYGEKNQDKSWASSRSVGNGDDIHHPGGQNLLTG